MMAGRAAARAVAMKRQHGHQNHLLYKKSPTTERVTTTLGGMMVVYTLLIVVYVILDVVSISDAMDFDKAYHVHQGAEDYDDEVHDQIDFMIKMRIILLAPTIVTMLVTWLNQQCLDAYLFSLPFSTAAFVLAAAEFTYYIDLKDVDFADE